MNMQMRMVIPEFEPPGFVMHKCSFENSVSLLFDYNAQCVRKVTLEYEEGHVLIDDKLLDLDHFKIIKLNEMLEPIHCKSTVMNFRCYLMKIYEYLQGVFVIQLSKLINEL